MVRLTGTFSRIIPRKVLVIGDLILDTYTIGKAKRISPEAPVAVVNVQREENRAGGAGNVILNLVSLATEVVAVGRVGDDPSGLHLRQLLSDEGVNIKGIVTQHHYPTPVKNRVIADNQQIVRVDYEQVLPLSQQLEQQLINSLPDLLSEVDVVSISDYGKGMLTRTLLQALISAAKSRKIPVIVDPKGTDFTKYHGATLIKPNLSESYAAAGLSHDAPLEQVASKILHQIQVDMLMITRSEAGISIFHQGGTRQDFPVKVHEIKDVTGAGDTVLAMLCCSIANGLTIGEAAQLSNIAAGIAIERFGCARISLSDLARRLLQQDIVNKVFDEEHLFALIQALKGRSFTLLALSGEKGLTSTIFRSIQELSKEGTRDLLVYIQDDTPQEEFVNMLASLQDIDFIVLKVENLRHLCDLIHPSDIFAVVGDRLESVDNLQQLLNAR